MTKIYKIIIFVFIILVALLFTTNIEKNLNIESKETEKVYKVAYYNHPPYYYINEKSEPDGYYHELMELIS
ncbi:MAG: hypothetical protein ACRC1Y_02915, partial [Paraclostridium sp.]